MRVNDLGTTVLLAATTVLAACSDSTTPAAGRPVTVSFSTAATAGTSASVSGFGMGLNRSITATSGTHTIVISKAQVVVARMELESVGATCASEAAAGDDSRDEHECAELTLAPSIVDLPVDAALKGALTIAIPAGTYRALEAKIRPIRADGDHGQSSAAFLAAHPEFAGVSIRVEGTYDNVPFVYTGTPRAKLETQFNPALVVDTKPVNVTVNVDISSWFKNAAGALIDPSSKNSADVSTIMSNIQRSFRAFHDDDRNGHDDEGEHRG